MVSKLRGVKLSALLPIFCTTNHGVKLLIWSTSCGCIILSSILVNGVCESKMKGDFQKKSTKLELVVKSRKGIIKDDYVIEANDELMMNINEIDKSKERRVIVVCEDAPTKLITNK